MSLTVDPQKDLKFKEKTDEQLIKLIDSYDMNMLKYIARLYEAVNNEQLDFSKIKNAVDALQQFNSKQEYNYLNNLLYPEKCKGVKIPSPIPVPSCSFQLHNCITLTTNASGNLALIFNPFFLSSYNAIKSYTIGENAFSLTNLSTLWVNNDNSLSGSDANQFFRAINIGQVIPGVYDQYRLVSASLVIKYIGRLDIASGVIGGAIVFDENPNIGGSIERHGVINPSIEKYGNFDLAMDSFYHQENLCLEGLRELYFPIDNSFEEYVRTIDGSHLQFSGEEDIQIKSEQDYYKSGFNWMVYVLGAPANSACFKLDIYCNYECLPNATFLNYLPLSMSPVGTSSDEKRKANLIVQQKPIMKLSETKGVIPYLQNTWEKLMNKFKNGLPGIGKLISKGIIGMIPSLKPGLTLASAMLSDVASNVSSSKTNESNKAESIYDKMFEEVE